MPMSRVRYERHVLLAFATAIALRMVFTVVTKGHDYPTVDGPYYLDVGKMVADGHGFVFPWIQQSWGTSFETAQHPPLMVWYVAAWIKVVGYDPLALRLLAGLVGSVGVLVGAGLGRELGGRRVGAVLAWILCLNPLVWINDAEIHSESLMIPLLLGLLWSVVRLRRQPDARHAAVVGAVLGLVALTRSEAALLGPLLIVPVVVEMAHLSVAARTRLVAVAGGVALALQLPWIAHNMSRFDEPVYFSTAGAIMQQANCEPTYYGDLVGYTSFTCFFDREELPIEGSVEQRRLLADEEFCRCPGDDWDCIEALCLMGDEGAMSAYGQQEGLHYARTHLDRVPYVLSIRLLRHWELYHPLDKARWDIDIDNRNAAATWLGLAWFYLSIPLVVHGTVLLRRRGGSTLLITAFVVSTSASALIAGSVTRFRLAFDVAACVAVALSLVELHARWAGQREADAGAPTGVGASAG